MISLRIHVKRYRRIFVVANRGNEHSFFCQPIEYRRNTFISNSYVLESVRSRSGFLLRLHHDRVFRRFGLWTTFVNAVSTNKSHIQINEITIFQKSEKLVLTFPVIEQCQPILRSMQRSQMGSKLIQRQWTSLTYLRKTYLISK